MPSQKGLDRAAGSAGAEGTASFLSLPQGAHSVVGSAPDAAQAEG